jgi:hypothetical protein
MENKVQAMVGQGAMKSVHRMTLPFRVDPPVGKVKFLGTSDGYWFAHIDVYERKKFDVEKVIMIYTKRKQLPSSAQKRSYCSLNTMTGCLLGI